MHQMKSKFLCVSFDQELRSRRELVASLVMEPENFSPVVWIRYPVNTGTVVAVWPLHCGVSDVIRDTYCETAIWCQKKPGETGTVS